MSHLGNISGDDCDLGHGVQRVVEPSREKLATGRGEVQPGDCSQLDGQALEQDGKDVAQEDDEQQLEAVGGSGSDVGGVVSRVNWEVCQRVENRTCRRMTCCRPRQS